MKWRVVGLLTAMLAVAAACTGGDGGEGRDGPAPAIVAIPTAVAAEGEEAPTPAPEGRIVDKYELEIEECFNRYDILNELLDEVQEFTTVVDCRRPHDGEIFASFFHPAEAGAPYPGSAAMLEWSNIACLGAFEEFVGTPFVLSALEIGTIRPIEEFWEDEARTHREVLCYVFAPDAQLSGPMRGSEF